MRTPRLGNLAGNPFRRGDRVRLNASGRAGYPALPAAGVVNHEPRRPDVACVRFDGWVSVRAVPVELLELVPNAEPVGTAEEPTDLRRLCLWRRRAGRRRAAQRADVNADEANAIASPRGAE